MSSYTQYPASGGVTAVAAVGSAPAAEGASISGSTLTLQPADATHPGVVTTGAQTIAGVKTWSGHQLPSSDAAVNLGASATRWNNCYFFNIYSNNYNDGGGFPRFVTTQSGVSTYKDNSTDGGTAVAHAFDTTNAFSTAGAKIASFRNAGTEKASVDLNGVVGLQYTDNSASPGATTISKASGRAAIASGASSVVVTNTLVSSSSKVLLQLESSAAGIANLVCVPGAGSFTVTSVNGSGAATATTANCKFSFVVFN
jgi:hypothetical protein